MIENVFNIGDIIQGFMIESVEQVLELDGIAYVMRHEATGLQLLYLNVPDEEKGFCIAFKTPATDNTGVFHVIEHSVTCGSDKYPIKDPFTHMEKTSMKTFLNAATAPNCTVFPVASTNEKDLMNLMDVYLDAVFHPAILHEPRIFQQEGWHYEWDGQNLSINGVVYNEMKGALADPNRVIEHAFAEELFPGSPYAFSHGGVPEDIATLSYEQFIDAYKRHYRPDKAAIVLFGELDIERVLGIIDANHLSRCNSYECGDADSSRQACECDKNPNQDSVISTDRVVHMEEAEEAARLLFGSASGEATDYGRLLALNVLRIALFGSQDAPLRRKILDSGIALNVNAFIEFLAKPTFQVMVQGVKPGTKQEFLDILMDGCRELVSTGIDKEQLRAILFAVEFETRTGGPAGKPGAAINMMMCIDNWAMGLPLGAHSVRYESEFEFVRQAIETDYFEKLLQEVFLDSKHYAVVELVPECANDMQPKQDWLAELASKMTSEELDHIAQQAEDLKRYHDGPDTPEALATLPRLSKDDCVIAPRSFSAHVEEAYGHTILRHGFTDRGVAHIVRCYDISHLSLEDLGYLRRFASFIGSSATWRHSANEVMLLKRGRLGTFLGSIVLDKGLRDGKIRAYYWVYTCSLADDIAFAAEFVDEMLHETTFDDRRRLREGIDRAYLSMKQELLSGRMCSQRAAAHLSNDAALIDALTGVQAFQFISNVRERCESDEGADEVLKRLEILCARVFGTKPMLYSFSGDDETLASYFAVEDHLLPEAIQRAEAFLASLPDGECSDARGQAINEVEPLGPGDEAFVIPGDSAYCTTIYDTFGTPSCRSGAWLIANKLASCDYLWDEVRAKGGAYGVSFSKGLNGLAKCSSTRSPNIDDTLDRFNGTAGWLRDTVFSDAEIDGYAIASVASLDAPMKGIERIVDQFSSYFRGWTPEDEERWRNEVLSTTAADINRLGAELASCADKRSTVVFASRELIEQSQHDFTVIDLLDA